MAALHSSISTKARENRVIYRALAILENRMREPDPQLTTPDAVRDYLRLLLGDLDREAFACLFLNSQNQLIEAEILFYGTLTQTAVYPREVVRRALQLNAGAVIFAHNHPSGLPEPSQADMHLTCALIDALRLVEVKTLDHFIVARRDLFSFAENCLLGVMMKSPEPKEMPAKRRGRPRKETKTITV